MKRSTLVTLVILAVLALDQALKIYIKLHFEYNEDYPILGLDWARLHFVENEGMAFGITFGWDYGKLLLSLFRIVMVGALIWYIRHLIALNAPTALLVCTGLITAGALGNIIDSAIYGVIFTESPYHGGLAQFASANMPGYSAFLHGKVVDMLYFPIQDFDIPEWVPRWGGQNVLFFSWIFNIADAAITCGVMFILLFQRHFFNIPHEEASAPNTETLAWSEATMHTEGPAGASETDDLNPKTAPNQDHE